MDEWIAGIDLCDDYTQVSCKDEEQTWIFPTVICRQKHADVWYVGELSLIHI